MSFKTNFLTSRPVVEKMIADAEIERLRLQTKLGSSTVSEYRSSQSAEETEQEKAEWISDLAQAEADILAAPVGSRARRKAELIRNDRQLKLDNLEFEEGEDTSDPRAAVRAAKSLKNTQALLGVQIEFIAELTVRLGQLPA